VAINREMTPSDELTTSDEQQLTVRPKKRKYLCPQRRHVGLRMANRENKLEGITEEGKLMKY